MYLTVASDKLKMKVREGAIISADNFKILAGILSNPFLLPYTLLGLSKLKQHCQHVSGRISKKYLRIG